MRTSNYLTGSRKWVKGEKCSVRYMRHETTLESGVRNICSSFLMIPERKVSRRNENSMIMNPKYLSFTKNTMIYKPQNYYNRAKNIPKCAYQYRTIQNYTISPYTTQRRSTRENEMMTLLPTENKIRIECKNMNTRITPTYSMMNSKMKSLKITVNDTISVMKYDASFKQG